MQTWTCLLAIIFRSHADLCPLFIRAYACLPLTLINVSYGPGSHVTIRISFQTHLYIMLECKDGEKTFFIMLIA